MRRKLAATAQRGFTLIEMMVALVLFAAITVGMMSVAVTMTNGYRDQEVTIATETSTRSTMELISQGLRGASPGVSLANAVTHAHACGTSVANSFRVENNLTVAGLTNTPDALTVVMPVGAVVTTSTTALTATTGAPSIGVRNATGLAAGDQILVTDHTAGHIYKIVSVTAGTPPAATLNLDTLGSCMTNAGTALGGYASAAGYPANSTVVRVLRARFSVGFLSGETVPLLMMDPDAEGSLPAEPIAEGIEDLQIAVGVDGDGNGVLAGESAVADDDEWLGNVTGELPYTNQVAVRAVRITLVARTAKELTGVNAFQLPAVEDRIANPSTDNFRRRILTSVIEVRNLGGSP